MNQTKPNQKFTTSRLVVGRQEFRNIQQQKLNYVSRSLSRVKRYTMHRLVSLLYFQSTFHFCFYRQAFIGVFFSRHSALLSGALGRLTHPDPSTVRHCVSPSVSPSVTILYCIKTTKSKSTIEIILPPDSHIILVFFHVTLKGQGHETKRLGPNISKTAGDAILATIANYYIVCCEAVWLAILASAWLLCVN